MFSKLPRFFSSLVRNLRQNEITSTSLLILRFRCNFNYFLHFRRFRQFSDNLFILCCRLRRSDQFSRYSSSKRSLCFWLLLRKPWSRYWLSGNNHNHERAEPQLCLLPMAPVTSRHSAISDFVSSRRSRVLRLRKKLLFQRGVYIKNIY